MYTYRYAFVHQDYKVLRIECIESSNFFFA